MTDREKSIVSAYTGITMLSGEKFQIFHKYIEDILCRPVYTHELAVGAVWQEIKEKSKDDFIEICKREDGWIPVSERLPKELRYVNCTCHSLIDDREDWVVETCYIPQPSNSPYSDWGNIPMLNDGDCEVVAWMYRDIPEPYKAEGSDKE